MSYIYEGVTHTDMSEGYMQALGMDAETIEYVFLQAEYEQQKQQLAELAKAKAYLSGTDWMVVREAEGGAALPDAIRANREQCRSLLDGTFSEPAMPQV